jgi:prevent-host-death family protein
MGAEKRISASEANRNFSGLLRRVRKGQEFVVTSHGEPVAKIVPCDDDAESMKRKKAWKKLMDRVSRQPVKIIEPWTREDLYER